MIAPVRAAGKRGAKKGAQLNRRVQQDDIFFSSSSSCAKASRLDCLVSSQKLITSQDSRFCPARRACTLFFSSIRWRPWPIRPARSFLGLAFPGGNTTSIVSQLSRDTDITWGGRLYAQAAPCIMTYCRELIHRRWLQRLSSIVTEPYEIRLLGYDVCRMT